jgi:hypothetical protein
MCSTFARSHADAIWPAFRHASRRLLRRVTSYLGQRPLSTSFVSAAVIAVSPPAAGASLTTITVTGTITSQTQGGISIVGQPFTLTTTFDPTAVASPCPQNANLECFESGSTTFTSGPYSGVSGYPNVQYDLFSGFNWGQSTGLTVHTEGFGSISSGSSPTATYLISNYGPITSATSIPNPLTATGTFSTSIPSTNNTLSYNAEGYLNVQGTIANLTISGSPGVISCNCATGTIDNVTQRVVVGQGIQLTASIPAGTWALSDPSGNSLFWATATVGGGFPAVPPPPSGCPAPPVPVTGEFPSCSGGPVLLTDPQFAAEQPPKFYWLRPTVTPSAPSAAYTVEYSYTQSDGTPASAKTYFTVEGPTPAAGDGQLIADPYPGQIGTVNVGVDPNNPQQPVLGLIGAPSFTDPSTNVTFHYGIKFTPSALLPSHYYGVLEWVQLIDNISEEKFTGAKEKCKVTGSGLDNTYPYNPYPVNNFYPQNLNVLPDDQFSTTDGPFVNLQKPYTNINMEFTADMYLMWRAVSDSSTHIVPDTIFVPLGYVE